MRKSRTREDVATLTDIPNVGPATARDLRRLGIEEPEQLRGRDPFQLYDSLCSLTGRRHDPCVIDVFIAAVRFIEGAPARPWWEYTAERKAIVSGKKS
ncbi:MAG: mitomycin resistance protein [Desulfobulbaceae bacterium]|nr:MAG: mitomycin resistance protein [Desulfobulbaceae bacterium]